MAELVFVGFVVNGRGTHVELGVPGKSILPNAPDNWPDRLQPGSLNVRVTRFPPEFSDRGLPLSAEALDEAGFRPAFVIPQSLMTNNQLGPLPGMPSRGAAQVWPAILTVEAGSRACWVLRRFGSGLASQIELVADSSLRQELRLTRDREWSASVSVTGEWQAP